MRSNHLVCALMLAAAPLLAGSDGAQFWAEGDFLYIRPCVDGLRVGEEIIVSVDLSQTLPEVDVLEKLEDLRFKWHPGFKVGVGFTTACPSKVEVGAFWTSFNARAHVQMAVDQFDGTFHYIKPNWLNALLGDIADEASAHWKLDFNVIDLAVRREIECCNWITFRPEVSIRGAIFEQRYDAFYHSFYNFSVDNANVLLDRDTFFNAKHTYHGVGVRAGSDFKCPVAWGLSIVGNGYASLLYGRFEIDQFYDGAVGQSAGEGVPALLPETKLLKNRFNAVRPALETEFGLTWEHSFCQDRFKVILGAYYQLAFWFRQNELINVSSIQSVVPIGDGNFFLENPINLVDVQGNLNYQGGRFQLSIAF